jgi:TRAP-type transport system small permease protein
MQRLMSIAETLSRVSARWVEIITIAMVLVMTILVIVQVLLRYLFSSSLSWSEEIARYLMIWVSFLAAGLALQKNLHIGVEALITRLGPRQRRRVSLVSKAAIFAFLVVLTVGGFQLAWFVRNQSSPALFLSMSWAYGASAAGGLFMAIQMFHSFLTEFISAGLGDNRK